MEDTREIRCLNKKGNVRYISEHLTKDAQYMRQMELTVDDVEYQKEKATNPFTAKKEEVEKGKLEEVAETLTSELGDFDEVKEEVTEKLQPEEKKENKKKK